MNNHLLFEEKQFLGFNSYSIARRMVLAIFCLVTFYYSENRMENADVLFLIGILILVLSILLLFVKYIHILVDEQEIQLKGMWKKQAIRVALSDIAGLEKSLYSKYHMNQPAFNVHVEEEIRFYTSGRDAVKIKLKNGSLLVIGTWRADELFRALKVQTGL